MKEKIALGLGLMVLVIVGVLLMSRRKAAAASLSPSYVPTGGITGGTAASAATPSPMAALAAAQAPRPGVPLGELPGVASASAAAYLGGFLPPLINAGVQAVIPQSEPIPKGYDASGLTADQIVQIEKIAYEGRSAVAADWRRINAEKAAGTYVPSVSGGG